MRLAGFCAVFTLGSLTVARAASFENGAGASNRAAHRRHHHHHHHPTAQPTQQGPDGGLKGSGGSGYTTTTAATTSTRTSTTTSASASASAGSGAGAGGNSNCFPSLGKAWTPPATLPADNTDWWCDPSTEYAFVGFSYEVTPCQDQDQLTKEFTDIRQRFNGRYVRLYGACDNPGFYDDVIEAAWTAGVGVHALVWFGFDGDDQWIGRRDSLFATLQSNPKAPFVTRVVQFGSEPLFDNVLDPGALTTQVNDAKANLSSIGIPVTVSEMAFGYMERGPDALNVLDATDSINIHMLPFFSQQASTANESWPLVMSDLQWFIDNGKGKKMYLDENGWPSEVSAGVQPNSPDAVADVANEHAYYNLLDSQCEFFKGVVGGGVGWFAHIYSENQEPGYGVYGDSGNLKFQFAARTSC